MQQNGQSSKYSIFLSSNNTFIMLEIIYNMLSKIKSLFGFTPKISEISQFKIYHNNAKKRLNTKSTLYLITYKNIYHKRKFPNSEKE